VHQGSTRPYQRTRLYLWVNRHSGWSVVWLCLLSMVTAVVASPMATAVVVLLLPMAVTVVVMQRRCGGSLGGSGGAVMQIASDGGIWFSEAPLNRGWDQKFVRATKIRAHIGGPLETLF
jgi:cobalamin synthase